jgi:dolichyl-phosphate beta-glucosyltransferase
MPMRDLALIIPCFNEQERIEAFLKASINFAPPVGWNLHWVLVDDGSSDNTYNMMVDACKKFPGIHMIRLNQNMGKGAAVRAGAQFAANRFHAVGFLDVDLSTPLDAIHSGLKKLEKGAELAIASRHAPGAVLKKSQGALRIFVGRCFSFFSSLFHRNSFTDTQCGLKLWSQRVNVDIASQLQTNRWSFDLELILRCERLNLEIQEFPVTWVNDERSKVSVYRDGLRMLYETIQHWWSWADKRLWLITLFFLGLGLAQAMRSSNDFAIYFTQAWSKIANSNFDIYEVNRPGQGGYYYSPFFALIGSFFVSLGLPALKLLYAVLNAAFLLAGWVLVKRLIRNSKLKLAFGVGILSLFFIANNILGQLLTGNVSLMVAFFSLLAIYTSTRARPVFAGFCWALAVNFKVYPIYLGLFFLWKRDYKVLFYGAIFSALTILAPALYWGWDLNFSLHAGQIEMLKAYGPQNDFGRLAYQSLAAMGFRAFEGLALNPDFGLRLGQGFALMLNLFVLSKLKYSSLEDSVWAGAFTFAFMALATPASWVHHSGFAYLPLFSLSIAHALQHQKTSLYYVLGLATLLYAFTTSGLIGKRLNDLLEAYSVPTIGLLLLMLAAYKAKTAAPKPVAA